MTRRELHRRIHRGWNDEDEDKETKLERDMLAIRASSSNVHGRARFPCMAEMAEESCGSRIAAHHPDSSA